ncbi:MAG: sensor histidine kinase KdpD [Phycisphaerae bacterium]
MSDNRPDPDALLAQVAADEKRAARGKLKVFFGACAGVGKTYAMLEEARKRAAEGVNLLVGYAEPHIRPDTEALLLGLEILPYQIVEYKGAKLKEFDLDAALARHPALICIDELAHTNAPGLRHAKRYQDVQELLDANIDVYTTLNVQHLESVNDIVERTSGIKVRATLPDWVLERADEVQLIDLPPEKLIERINEGKIYRQHEADHITKQFFNQGNLSALRELALRRTADRVDAQMEAFRQQNAVQSLWPAADRLLVCVGPSPFSIRLVRAASRMARALHAEWIAAYVKIPSKELPPEARERINQAFRLAEQLGAKTIALQGDNPTDEIIAYARSKSVSRILIGKPLRARWHERVFGSIVDDLIHKSGPIDILVIRDEKIEPSPGIPVRLPVHRSQDWRNYIWTLAIVTATTLLGAFLYHVLGEARRFSNTNVLMLDLLGVLLVALRFGRGPAVLASLVSVLAFDYTVVPPYYSFAVSDTQYLLTFGVMFVTALVISTLTHRITEQAESARQREQRTAALLDLSRELAATREKSKILAAAIRQITDVFNCKCIILLATEAGPRLEATDPDSPDAKLVDGKELGAAEWTLEHDQISGRGTDTLPSAEGMYLPLRASRGAIGVLGIFNPDLIRFADPERLHLLEAFANQTAMAVERAQLAQNAQTAWERVEAELIRNTLLSGVSHDLRTPLTAITGSVSTLLDNSAKLAPADRIELLLNIANEADHMERLVNNLLDMTRLESGRIDLQKELYPLQELVVSTLERLKKRLGARSVDVDIRTDLPLLSVDGPLFEQVLMNLVENALEYTPAGTPIEIAAAATETSIIITVADHGPSLPPDDPARVFQKFFRSPRSTNHRGIGLGLAIVKQVVELHGGQITAANRSQGGALFTITLPNVSGQRSFHLAEG